MDKLNKLKHGEFHSILFNIIVIVIVIVIVNVSVSVIVNVNVNTTTSANYYYCIGADPEYVTVDIEDDNKGASSGNTNTNTNLLISFHITNTIIIIMKEVEEVCKSSLVILIWLRITLMVNYLCYHHYHL
jgi:hypothetical protein